MFPESLAELDKKWRFLTKMTNVRDPIKIDRVTSMRWIFFYSLQITHLCAHRNLVEIWGWFGHQKGKKLKKRQKWHFSDLWAPISTGNQIFSTKPYRYSNSARKTEPNTMVESKIAPTLIFTVQALLIIESSQFFLQMRKKIPLFVHERKPLWKTLPISYFWVFKKQGEKERIRVRRLGLLQEGFG